MFAVLGKSNGLEFVENGSKEGCPLVRLVLAGASGWSESIMRKIEWN